MEKLSGYALLEAYDDTIRQLTRKDTSKEYDDNQRALFRLYRNELLIRLGVLPRK